MTTFRERVGLYWKKDLEDSFMAEGQGGRNFAYLNENGDTEEYDDNNTPIFQCFPKQAKELWGEEVCQAKQEDCYNMQQNFVKKVYGIFLCQITIMACYIFAITLNKPKTDLTDDDNYEEDKTKIKSIARNFYVFIACTILAIIDLTVIITQMKKLRDYTVLNYILGYLFCIFLTYIAGFATYRMDSTAVFAAFACTLAISMIMAFFARRITDGMSRMKGPGKNKGKKIMMKVMGPVFGMLASNAILLVLILYTFPQDGKTSQVKKGLLLYAGLAIVMFYMMLDTWAITQGKYQKMISEHDHIYGSAKLFADFILCFTLLSYFCQGDGK